MSSDKDPASLISAYTEEIRRLLPHEIAIDVVSEIEEHLWDRAEDLGGGTASWASTRQAIIKMGPPFKMAQAYLEYDEQSGFLPLETKNKLALISPELFPVFKLLTITTAFISTIVFGFNIILSFTTGRLLLDKLVAQVLTSGVAIFGIIGFLFIIFLILSQLDYKPPPTMYNFQLKKSIEYFIIVSCIVGGVFLLIFERFLLLRKFEILLIHLIISMAIIGLFGEAGVSILKISNKDNIRRRIQLSYVSLALETLLLPIAILLFLNPGFIPLIYLIPKPSLQIGLKLLPSILYGGTRLLIIGTIVLGLGLSIYTSMKLILAETWKEIF